VLLHGRGLDLGCGTDSEHMPVCHDCLRAELAADQAVAARLPELPQQLGSHPAAAPPAARQLPSGRSLSALRCVVRSAVQDRQLRDCFHVRFEAATPYLTATLLAFGADRDFITARYQSNGGAFQHGFNVTIAVDDGMRNFFMCASGSGRRQQVGPAPLLPTPPAGRPATARPPPLPPPGPLPQQRGAGCAVEFKPFCAV
jgi:hypothetical protein